MRGRGAREREEILSRGMGLGICCSVSPETVWPFDSTLQTLGTEGLSQSWPVNFPPRASLRRCGNLYVLGQRCPLLFQLFTVGSVSEVVVCILLNFQLLRLKVKNREIMKGLGRGGKDLGNRVKNLEVNQEMKAEISLTLLTIFAFLALSS